MTVGLALLAYAAIVSAAGPLARQTDGSLVRAPRLQALLLLAASWSVLTALILAGLTVAMPGTALSGGLSDLLGACILRVRAAYATPGGAAAAGAGLTMSGAIALRVAWALLAVSRARRAEGRRQRIVLALCGRRASELDVTVLDHPQPAAYCLPGRARTVVLTTGTLTLLTRPQVAAVLAHEHAHLQARHHRLLGWAALVSRVLPELPLTRDLPRRVRSLLEMHADDLAARHHDPRTLATALVAVATARSGAASAQEPSSVLGAAGRDTALRVRRLLEPPVALSARRRRVFQTGVAAFGAVPLLLALTPAAVAASQPPIKRTAEFAVVRQVAVAPRNSVAPPPRSMAKAHQVAVPAPQSRVGYQ